ncbi:MAG: ATP-binding cassette domain-containing protein [Lactobacillus sp.]|nr:MAG: ATP-binding cassette domain-containing protein [Lactobacillus sp.]
MDSVLELRNVRKSFGKQVVLDDINLTIHQGDIYGLIGRNGAGKTTILKTIVSLIHQDKGEILLFGRAHGEGYMKQLTRTGSVIETPVANNELTARQNLKYYCKVKGIVNRNAVDEALDFVGLSDTKNKKFKNFSLGMRQKLGLAIALLNQPDFLILDEPINGLDPIAIVEFRNLLIRLNQTRQITILISSHILGELYQMVTKFGILNHGKIIKELTKEEFEIQSREFIQLDVDQPQLATTVLDRLGIHQFKVVGDHEIAIYELNVSNAQIVNELVATNVQIETIIRKHTNLENYFKTMIEDGDES